MKAFFAIALCTFSLCSTATAGQYNLSDKVIEQYSQLTLAELTNHKLVRQQYDYSCGAAALATILKHQFQIETSEKAIIEKLLYSSNKPDLVLKTGFSLLDLKRFALSMGVEGAGYADLTIEELQQRNTPAILPVNIDNFNHFVVFKGIKDGYVYLGDPLWGNIVLTARQFLASWNRGIAFFLYTQERTQPNMLDYKHAYLASDWKNATTSNALVIRSALHNMPRF